MGFGEDSAAVGGVDDCCGGYDFVVAHCPLLHLMLFVSHTLWALHGVLGTFSYDGASVDGASGS